MRRLIVQQWSTADGIVAQEDGGLGFVSGEPFSEASDPAFVARLMAVVDQVDTMVLGARTYAMASGYWPHAEEQGEYGRRLNGLAKVVASGTLTEAPWGSFPAARVVRDPVAAVRELKRAPGRDLWLWGSLSLMRTLLDAGLVDVVQLLVCPVALGRGARIFERPRRLELQEATGFSNGIVLLRYGVESPPS